MPYYGSQVRKVRARVSGYLKRTVLARASWIDDAQMNLQRHKNSSMNEVWTHEALPLVEILLAADD